MTPTYVDVHRFWSPLTYSHFYTIGEDEAQMLIDEYAYAWSYEGIAYRAMADNTTKGSSPVYRFWSQTQGYHFFTIDEKEANSLIDLFLQYWTYEGIAFYAYAAGNQPDDASPVYRFKSSLLNRHLLHDRRGRKADAHQRLLLGMDVRRNRLVRHGALSLPDLIE